MLSLSTGFCSIPQTIDGVLQTWRQTVADLSETSESKSFSMAIGARIPAEVQRDLLKKAHTIGQAVGFVIAPAVDGSGRTAPSIAPRDRSEARSAIQSLGSLIESCGRTEVLRLVFDFVDLSLKPNVVQLRRVAADNQWQRVVEAMGDLAKQREAHVTPRFDRMRGVLDALIERAVDVGVELLLPAPAAWPHQAPSGLELERLFFEFEGAPLASIWCSDWAHLGAQIEAQLDPAVASFQRDLAHQRSHPQSHATQTLDPFGFSEAMPHTTSGLVLVSASLDELERRAAEKAAEKAAEQAVKEHDGSASVELPAHVRALSLADCDTDELTCGLLAGHGDVDFEPLLRHEWPQLLVVPPDTDPTELRQALAAVGS
jgi:hypothetical protein